MNLTTNQTKPKRELQHKLETGQNKPSRMQHRETKRYKNIKKIKEREMAVRRSNTFRPTQDGNFSELIKDTSSNIEEP